MSDIDLSVLLSRTLLGLGALEVARGNRYYCAPQFIGAMVQWNRQQVTSPYLDGSVTVHRSRQQVTEQLVFEVKGHTLAELRTNIDELVAAFVQDSFTMTITADDASFGYECEAADYQVGFFNPARMAGRQCQVSFGVPRNPVPLVGVV